MFKKIFKQNNQVLYAPLRHDLSSLDIKHRVKASRIIRHSNKKPLKQSLKERSRTLHTLSLPHPLNNRKTSPYGFCPRNGEIEEWITNLRHLKSLKSLNINLSWLLTSEKSHAQFARSLKHLKNLSVIHFYVLEEFQTLLDIPQLYQSLCKVPIASKAEIRLSFVYSFFGRGARRFGQLLQILSCFGRLSVVHFGIGEVYLSEIKSLISTLQDYKSISRIDVTITRIYSLEHISGLQNFFESLKCVKSLKESRINFAELGSLSFDHLRILVPYCKDALQHFNLGITFWMKREITEELTTPQWKSFIRSIQKSHSQNRFRANYNGKLCFALTVYDDYDLIIVVLMFFMFAMLLYVLLFLGRS